MMACCLRTSSPNPSEEYACFSMAKILFCNSFILSLKFDSPAKLQRYFHVLKIIRSACFTIYFCDKINQITFILRLFLAVSDWQTIHYPPKTRKAVTGHENGQISHVFIHGFTGRFLILAKHTDFGRLSPLFRNHIKSGQIRPL